jgi:hypothetical protein
LSVETMFRQGNFGEKILPDMCHVSDSFALNVEL